MVIPDGESEVVDAPRESGTVEVPRRSIEQLYAGVRWLVLMAVAFGLVFTYDACQDVRKDDRQDAVDEHLAATDGALERTSQRLEDLAAAEAREDEEEDAGACVRSHVVYGVLTDLLSRLGEASADLSDAEVSDLIATYPPPTCDRATAQAVLDSP